MTTQNGLLIFLGKKTHSEKHENRLRFRRKQSQQQRQTLEIVEDFAGNLRKFNIFVLLLIFFFFPFFCFGFFFLFFFFVSSRSSNFPISFAFPFSLCFYFFIFSSLPFSVVRADAKLEKIAEKFLL